MMELDTQIVPVRLLQNSIAALLLATHQMDELAQRDVFTAGVITGRLQALTELATVFGLDRELQLPPVTVVKSQ